MIDVATLILTRGQIAIIDLVDMPLVAGHKWCSLRAPNGRWYAKRTKACIYLHRVILAAPDHLDVDHIDHDGLNNRRSNLRLVTRMQNNHNQRKTRGMSKYKGVTWSRKNRRWIAQFTPPHGVRRYLGSFEHEQDAARAYDAAALEHFGAFACLNFSAP
jgi:hypothetical protein